MILVIFTGSMGLPCNAGTDGLPGAETGRVERRTLHPSRPPPMPGGPTCLRTPPCPNAGSTETRSRRILRLATSCPRRQLWRPPGGAPRRPGDGLHPGGTPADRDRGWESHPGRWRRPPQSAGGPLAGRAPPGVPSWGCQGPCPGPCPFPRGSATRGGSRLVVKAPGGTFGARRDRGDPGIPQELEAWRYGSAPGTGGGRIPGSG